LPRAVLGRYGRSGAGTEGVEGSALGDGHTRIAVRVAAEEVRGVGLCMVVHDRHPVRIWRDTDVRTACVKDRIGGARLLFAVDTTIICGRSKTGGVAGRAVIRRQAIS